MTQEIEAGELTGQEKILSCCQNGEGVKNDEEDYSG